MRLLSTLADSNLKTIKSTFECFHHRFFSSARLNDCFLIDRNKQPSVIPRRVDHRQAPVITVCNREYLKKNKYDADTKKNCW